MEFDKSRCYSAVNADELEPGDKVIVAYDMYQLKERVKMSVESVINEIETIYDDCYCNRFKVKYNENYPLPLAYLVARKENCTNCGNRGNFYCSCFTRDKSDDELSRTVCDNYIRLSEPKAEPHYRPFKDTDELLKVWGEKIKLFCDEIPHIVMPLVWVKYKYDENSKGSLIINFSNDCVCLSEKDEDFMTMYDLFINYTFLDGSPCGVEE